jgi:hypothetical protein
VAPAEPLQTSVTVVPLADVMSPPGAAGGPAHGAGPDVPTVTATSFDAGLDPAAFTARTRM